MQNNMKLEILAYGKINLYLDVLNKMENGYHNIESVMQSVSLCDKLTLEISDTEGENIIEISSDTDKIPNDNTNLVYKACSRFIDFVASKNLKIEGKKFTFHIEKKIPISAGMAGGSSDCASALKLMNMAFDSPLNDNELLSLGASIGADVGFCLTGGTAICRGIGDKITKINSFSDVYLVCAIDNSSVSTPVAFKMLDDMYGTNPEPSASIDILVEAIEIKDLNKVSSSLFNKFENVIIPKNDGVKKIKNILLNNGALGALMSGSGPSVFGIFGNENDQINAYKALKEQKISAFLCKTI